MNIFVNILTNTHGFVKTKAMPTQVTPFPPPILININFQYNSMVCLILSSILMVESLVLKHSLWRNVEVKHCMVHLPLK